MMPAMQADHNKRDNEECAGSVLGMAMLSPTGTDGKS